MMRRTDRALDRLIDVLAAEILEASDEEVRDALGGRSPVAAAAVARAIVRAAADGHGAGGVSPHGRRPEGRPRHEETGG